MEQIDVKALEEAVIIFYRSGSQQQNAAQSAAHDWLTKAQCSRQAWSFVWELMQIGKSSEVQFFGATTLHTKLMKYWQEVPKENHEELKQKLFQTIIIYGNGPKIVLNRLCISLSAYIVQMLSENPMAIEEILDTLQSQPLPNVSSATQLWILMEVLCGIPEELNAIYTSVQRVQIRNEIIKRTQFVIDIVQQLILNKCESNLTDEDMTTLLKAVKCVEAWLKNGGFSLDNCEMITNALLRLINKCYWNNTDGDGCMSGDENELTEACIKALTAMLLQPDAHRYQNTALRLLTLIVDSLSPITKAEWKENNSNEDIAFNLYSLFVGMSECHSKLLIQGVLSASEDHRNLYMRLIQEILQCTDKPGIYPVEESCSVLSMGFWYMLQDEVLSNENVLEKNKGLELIGPLYSHLTKILVRKAQQPDEDSLDKWTTDDLETFRCYRQDISDTLLYCHEVLHHYLVEILLSILDESILRIQQNSSEWMQLEASIYAIYSIAEHIETEERKCIPKFVMILSEIPYAKLHTKILGTALDAIGAYSEWFKANPDYLTSAIQLLVIGLNSTQTSQATLGLKDICRECQLELQPFVEPLLQACQQAIQNGHLINSDSVRLMYSIGRLMSMLPQEKLLHWLDVVVSPCFEELRLLTQNRSVAEPTKIRTLFRLNMISTLFSSLNINVGGKTEPEPTDNSMVTNEKSLQPVLFVMQKTMPIFKEVGTIWYNDLSVIEALCGAVKYAVTNLLDDFKPMLPDLCNLIITIFQSSCVGPAIDIAKTCIILFYKDDQCQSIMRQLFFEVISYNLNLFATIPDREFSSVADIMESFYVFNAQIVKKLPQIYGDTNTDCEKLLNFAIKAITLPETNTAKQAVTFLTHFITQSRQYPIMNNAVLKKGEEIIHATLLCIGIYSLQTHVDVYADIFVAFNKKYPAELIAWMKVLEVAEFPTTFVTNADKEHFMKQIIREKVNKRLVQGYIREFSGKCREIMVKI